MHKQVFKRRRMVAFVAAAGVFGLAALFYQYNQAPVVGTVRPPAPAPQVAAATAAHFSGTLVAFDFSTVYKTVENRAGPVRPILEQYSLTRYTATEGSRRISITVRDFSVGPMAEDSAYTFRRNEADQYEADELTMGEEAARKTVQTMTKKDGTEVTYFIPGKKAYAIVSATSTRPNNDFREEAAALVRSFVWR